MHTTTAPVTAMLMVTTWRSFPKKQKHSLKMIAEQSSPAMEAAGLFVPEQLELLFFLLLLLRVAAAVPICETGDK